MILQYASKINNLPWVSATDISDPGVRINCELVLYCDGSDYFFVAWVQTFDGSTFVLESAAKRAESEWVGFTIHLTENVHPVNVDCSVNDKMGRIVYVYIGDDDADFNILTAQTKLDAYIMGLWTYPEKLSVEGINAQPKVATTQIENYFYAAAVWRYFDGSNTIIQYSPGVGPVLLPPSNLSVDQEFVDFHVYTEYCNVLRWDPCPQDRIKGYLIYRNGTYVIRIPGNVTEYIDHNQNLNETVSYGISTINEDFCQSEINYITFP